MVVPFHFRGEGGGAQRGVRGVVGGDFLIHHFIPNLASAAAPNFADHTDFMSLAKIKD